MECRAQAKETPHGVGSPIHGPLKKSEVALAWLKPDWPIRWENIRRHDANCRVRGRTEEIDRCSEGTASTTPIVRGIGVVLFKAQCLRGVPPTGGQEEAVARRQSHRQTALFFFYFYYFSSFFGA